MFKHNLKIGEDIWIGDARISLQKKSGQHALIYIDAPQTVKIRTSQERPEQEGKQKEQAD